MLILSENMILYSTAFKYPRYKKVYLDENPKTMFSDMKNSKKPHKYRKTPSKKILSYLS